MHTVTRFPPSPTGYLHVGGARTALFNWLYAKKTGGELVFRLEDTDRQRSTQRAVEVIFEAMEWLGLDWNQGPFYQSQRLDRYRAVIQQLLEDGNAYYCLCSKQKIDATREAQRAAGHKPRYDRHCRSRRQQPTAAQSAVVRFKNPLQGAVVFEDVVRGKVVINNAELDDLIIARADGMPTYHLGVVVDDIDMAVTHVIRGDDHTNNTPRQINIFHALGAPPPVFAHVPMILGADGRRLSKRHGAVSVLEYRDLGILPEALLNYLARLGWSHADQEIFSIAEMIQLFDIRDINKAASNFDMAKLLWVNQRHLQAAPLERLTAELGARLKRRGLNPEHGPSLAEVAEAMRARAQTLEEMADKVMYLYGDLAGYAPKAAKKHLTAAAVQPLQAVGAELSAVADWQEPAINQAIQTVLQAEALKLGDLAQPLRVAISGGAATPPIETTVKLVGKQRVAARINQALRWIEQHGAR